MDNKKKGIGIFIAAILVMSVFGAFPMTVSAASEAEIQQAIDNGTAWLAAQQNPDGPWGTTYEVGHTGLALIKLCSHDPITYSDNISRGLDYLFANAYIVAIADQTAGDPDTNGNGIGVVFYADSGHSMYETGIAVMALAECGCATPDAVVNVPGSAVDGWTYEQVLQDAVDYIAFAQTDSGYGRGGWTYTEQNNSGPRSDNSISGYVALGLGYVETSECEITVPSFVYDELDIWVDYIQNDVDGGTNDGGSGYTDPDGWVNIYKTGNLLFQMALVGNDETTGRVQDATDYIVRHWNDPIDPGWNGTPADYQAMYTTMKGLEVFGIDTIDGIDWFEEFSDVIVAQQNPDGSWPGNCEWGDSILCTEWALFTLQKEVPKIIPTPAPVPTLTPIGLIALVGLLSVIAAISIRTSIRKKRR